MGIKKDLVPVLRAFLECLEESEKENAALRAENDKLKYDVALLSSANENLRKENTEIQKKLHFLMTFKFKPEEREKALGTYQEALDRLRERAAEIEHINLHREALAVEEKAKQEFK